MHAGFIFSSFSRHCFIILRGFLLPSGKQNGDQLVLLVDVLTVPFLQHEHVATDMPPPLQILLPNVILSKRERERGTEKNKTLSEQGGIG